MGGEETGEETEAKSGTSEPVRFDGSLLRRLRTGEGDAATAVFLRYARRLERLARARTSQDLLRRFDAEDVVQSVFRTFFRRAQRGEYDIPEGEELWKLLLVITLNKLRAMANHHHAQRRDVGRTRSLQGEVPRTSAMPDDPLPILEEVVAELIGTLPEASQRIVRMRIDGEPMETISTTVRRSRRTVERVLQHFRESLRARLNEGLDVSDG